ncbi:MAG TPA: AI-2E family transporter, partial [Cyclobacteriaceae bacterium]|nr:AI-2E family transporter [Cyclobacteriaceae bacterium]
CMLIVLVFISLSGLVIFFLFSEAMRILQDVPTIQLKLRQLVINVIDDIEAFSGLPLKANLEFDRLADDSVKNIAGWMVNSLSTVGSGLVIFTITPLYMFFMLYYRGLLKKVLNARFTGDSLLKINNIFALSEMAIRNYLIGTFLMVIVCAVLSMIVLSIFGVEYAFFFSILLAILNLIPYIGNFIGFIIILIFYYLSNESVSATFFLLMVMYISNLIQENLIRPFLVGSKMEINAMAVLLALVAGGYMWGFSGMIIFIPVVGILKILLENDKTLKPFSLFFGSDQS